MRNLAKYALKYATYMLHICSITEICGVNVVCACLPWTKMRRNAENAIVYAEKCDCMRIFANLCINRYSKCINKYSKFENAITCGKICDMCIFAKYAKYAAIA